MGRPYRQLTLAAALSLAALAGTQAFAQAPRIDIRDMQENEKQQLQGAYPPGTSFRVPSEREGARARRDAERRAQWDRDREATRARARAWVDPRDRR